MDIFRSSARSIRVGVASCIFISGRPRARSGLGGLGTGLGIDSLWLFTSDYYHGSCDFMVKGLGWKQIYTWSSKKLTYINSLYSIKQK